MIRVVISSFIVATMLPAFISCKSESKSQQGEIKNFDNPPTIVYKTRGDYYKNVAVTLSDDKSKIVSYPHPSDLKKNGNFALPDILEKNYLLDNRGIGPNTAFLSITYEEFALMSEVPPVQELYNKIIDKDPFTEMYNCGNRYQYKNPVDDFNRLIKDGKLKNCRKLK
jgi:hypothetical protein